MTRSTRVRPQARAARGAGLDAVFVAALLLVWATIDVVTGGPLRRWG
jgi:hypothetical protein